MQVWTASHINPHQCSGEQLGKWLLRCTYAVLVYMHRSSIRSRDGSNVTAASGLKIASEGGSLPKVHPHPIQQSNSISGAGGVSRSLTGWYSGGGIYRSQGHVSSAAGETSDLH